MITPKRFREAYGLWAGGVIAPVVALGSLIRQDRLFHARGVTFRGTATPAQDINPKFKEVADALSQGEALVRLSPGMWSGDTGLLPDVLGMAIRFGTSAGQNFEPRCGSQDVTLITAANMWALPVAALGTNQRDFLDNKYYSGSYEIAKTDSMRLRAVPLTPPAMPAGDRFTRLREAVEQGGVKFRIDAISMKDQGIASPLLELTLEEEVQVDEEQLGFLPFRTGQPLRPTGLVQFMRPMPYLLSQYARQI